MAGLVAGVRLAQGGRRPIVLEKSTELDYLCNSRMTGGALHGCGVSLGQADPALAEGVIADGPRVVRFLLEHGVAITTGENHPGIACTLQPPAVTPEGYAWKDRGGDRMMRRLEARLVELGGLLLRGHEAQHLMADRNRIRGCSGTTFRGEK